MRILLLAKHLNTGGVTSYLLTLARGLKEKGCDVLMATSGGEREEDFKVMGCRTIQLDIDTKSEFNPRIYVALGVLKKMVQTEKIDIIHSHTRVTQIMGEILSSQMKCVHVSTCHGYFKPNVGRTLFPAWGKKTIAISKEVKNHLMNDFHQPEKQIELIPSGVDIVQFEPIDASQKENVREKYRLGDESIIGIIARLSDVKGIDILIKAMSRIHKIDPKVKLLIVGEGKEERFLKSLVNDLQLKSCIQFLPIVNRTNEILSVLDIFVMPSRQEGLGLSIMEAQASGLPVVASNVGGIPTLIEHDVTGILVVKESPEALADALLDLLKDTDKRNRLGQAGRAFIVQHYSSPKMIDKTYQLYQSLLN